MVALEVVALSLLIWLCGYVVGYWARGIVSEREKEHARHCGWMSGFDACKQIDDAWLRVRSH